MRLWGSQIRRDGVWLQDELGRSKKVGVCPALTQSIKHKAVKLMLNTTNHLRDWPYKIMAMFEDWPNKLMGVYHDCPCQLMGVFHDCPGLASPPGPGPPDYCQVGSSDFLYFVSWIKKGWFLKWDKCKRTSVLINFHLFIISLELRQTCIFFSKIIRQNSNPWSHNRRLV